MRRKIEITGNPQKPVFLKDLEEGEFGFISETAVVVDKPINKRYNNCAINLLAFVYAKSDEEHYIPVSATKDGIDIDLSEIILYEFMSIDDLSSGDDFKWAKIYVEVGLSSKDTVDEENDKIDLSKIKMSDLDEMSLSKLNLLLEQFTVKEMYEYSARCRDLIKEKQINRHIKMSK